MSWFSRFLTSSIGQKLVMSLTGLFLISFLLIHLIGNLQLLLNDGGEAFNKYAYFMTHNKLIKTVSYLLYGGILLHAVQGILLYVKNRSARGSVGYAVKVTRATNTNSKVARRMAFLGLLILVFLGIHMGDFWWSMKTNQVPMVTYGGEEYQNLYFKVAASFEQGWIVAVYVISMVGLALHLLHGFQSAFQTLGLNHKKYTPFIEIFGKVFSWVISAAFAVIPLYYYFLR